MCIRDSHIGNPKIGSTSIKLDGDDYLTVAAHADFNFGTSDFCIEWWWRGDFGGNDQFWSFGTSGEAWMCYQEAANKIRVTMGSAGTRQWDTDSSTVWQGDNQWHHFALTKTSTTAKLYIDGVEETTINSSYTNNPAASINLSSFILGIGAMSNGAQPLNVNSNIDEFRISDTVRSADWAAASYATQNSPSTYLTLNCEENSTTKNCDDPDTAKDRSGACGFDRDCTPPRITNHGESETPDGFSINNNVFEENQELFNKNPTIQGTVGEPVTIKVRAWENLSLIHI